MEPDHPNLSSHAPTAVWDPQPDRALCYCAPALWDSGDRAEAVTMMRNRVKVYQRLAQTDPARCQSQLNSAKEQAAAFSA